MFWELTALNFNNHVTEFSKFQLHPNSMNIDNKLK